MRGGERGVEQRKGEDWDSAMNQHGEKNLPVDRVSSQQVCRTWAAAMSDHISAHLEVTFSL